ncbi:hypothetical protein BJ085DRAFT_14862, partial [Dimargaris cristalligena]
KKDAVFYQQIERHKQENPLSCPVCQATFSQGSNRTRHMLIYTGDKYYHCPRCNLEFARLVALNDHKRRQCSNRPRQTFRYFARVSGISLQDE